MYKNKYLKYKVKYLNLKSLKVDDVNSENKSQNSIVIPNVIGDENHKSIKESEKYKKIMKGGGKKYEEKDIISIIEKSKINLPLKEIKNFVDVGMGGLHQNAIPIGTNGITTCMGIGTHIDGINYFSHASPVDYSGITGKLSLINEWKELLENNIDNINSIYLYQPHAIPINSLPFLIILNNLYLIDKIKYVNTTVFDYKRWEYTSVFNDNFKVGISKDGPWGYDYS